MSPVVRKTKAKDKERLERARSMWRLLRDAGPEGLSVSECVQGLGVSTAEVLTALQDVRDKGVAVWALSESTGVRFALVPKVTQAGLLPTHDAPDIST